MFKVSKKCHQVISLLCTYCIRYTSLFWVKSGEKWSPIVCFHPLLEIVGKNEIEISHVISFN